MQPISVIIPVYNAETTIAETIQSVLAQTYSNLEVLLVDDGSSDRSLMVCQQFDDPRLRMIRQPNQGPSAARNTGIRHASGEFIAFLDADDLWHPTKLAAHVAHLNRAPQVGLSFSRSAFMDAEGNPVNYYQMPRLTGITVGHLFCRNPIGNGSAPVIRRQVFKDIAFVRQTGQGLEDCYFDPCLLRSEDIECWLRILLTTDWQIEGIPDVLTFYRINNGGLSSSIIKHLDDFERMVDKTRTYAPEVVAQWAAPARAYQLRYLARRAIRSRDRTMAIALSHRALQTHWPILLKEPRRTGLTLAAAYLLWLMPAGLYRSVERVAYALTGVTQRRQIEKDIVHCTIPETAARPMKILLVCSTGGHFRALQQLQPFWSQYPHLWVTFRTTPTETALQNESVVWAYSPTNRNIPNLLRNFWLAWSVLRRERPDLVLTTGAGVAVPFLVLAKLLGHQTVFVESITRAEELSLSARLVLPFLDALYVHWDGLKKKYAKAILIQS